MIFGAIFAPFVFFFQFAVCCVLFGGAGVAAWFNRVRIQDLWASMMTSSLHGHSAEPIATTRRHVRRVTRINPVDELRDNLHTRGCECIQMHIAVDLTESNNTTGRRSNGGRSLHDVTHGVDADKNPYQRAILAIANALIPFDADKRVPLLGFGDKLSTERRTGWFDMSGCADGVDCSSGPDALLAAYTENVQRVTLWGPTDFAPIIEHTSRIAMSDSGAFHVLIILCDGAVSQQCWVGTLAAIQNASISAPLSIVIVGLGDGPFGSMEHLDNELSFPGKSVDNVHFVAFEELMGRVPAGCHPNDWFASEALKELPDHYSQACQYGLFRSSSLGTAEPPIVRMRGRR